MRLKTVVLFFVSIMLVMLSCERKNEYVEITYDNICQVTDIYIQGSSIYPVYEYDQTSDAESRTFYADADTSLFFNIKQLPPAKNQYMSLSAMDWRITSISVVTLDNFDVDHPAGSSLNDILKVRFWYHKEIVEIPLGDVDYGSIMLADYYTYPYPGDSVSLDLVYPNDCAVRPAIEVTIENAFGRCMTARTGDNK